MLPFFDVKAWHLVADALADVMEIGISDFGDFFKSDLIVALFPYEDDFITDLSFRDA